MADVSKLRLDGTTYDVKDENARKYIVMVNEQPQSATKLVVNTIETEINLALQSDVDAAVVKVSKPRNDRRYILIGDSYGMRHTKNWRSLVESSFVSSDTETSYVVFSNAIGSYGFSPDTLKFLTILQNGVESLTEEQIESVTDIVVVGGWNDARELKRGKTMAEVQNAILTFCDYVETTFPNAMVTLEYVGWQRGTGGQDGVTRNHLLNARLLYDITYHRILRHGTSMFKVMTNTSLMDDSNFHPNDNIAADHLYYALVNDLCGNGYVYNYKYSMGSSAFTAASTGNMNISSCEILDGMVRFDVTITGITGVTSGNAVGTFDLTKLPFALWEARTFNAHVLENGADLYCILNTNGELKVYGGSSIPSSSWTLIIRETYPMIYT